MQIMPSSQLGGPSALPMPDQAPISTDALSYSLCFDTTGLVPVFSSAKQPVP